MPALLEKIKKIFHPRKQNRTILVGKALDLTFRCANNEFPCPRGVHNPGRKKKALKKCWGCPYLEFVVPETKLERRSRDSPLEHL